MHDLQIKMRAGFSRWLSIIAYIMNLCRALPTVFSAGEPDVKKTMTSLNGTEKFVASRTTDCEKKGISVPGHVGQSWKHVTHSVGTELDHLVTQLIVGYVGGKKVVLATPAVIRLLVQGLGG